MIERRGRLASAAIVGAMAFVPTSTATAATETETFAYTGAAQTWTVPPGITEATFDLYGARAEAARLPRRGSAAEPRRRSRSSRRFDPGLRRRQGQQDGHGRLQRRWLRLPRSGGGASDIRIGGTALADRVLVAGGGGGAGNFLMAPASAVGGAGAASPAARGLRGREDDVAVAAANPVRRGNHRRDCDTSASSASVETVTARRFPHRRRRRRRLVRRRRGATEPAAAAVLAMAPPHELRDRGATGNGLVTISYELDPAP